MRHEKKMDIILPKRTYQNHKNVIRRKFFQIMVN